ncbi:proline racemase family protein [Neobacillus sp. WH10]|uniref:proline racemase family protein n=1 Tax=Neobacillus sp. WH10 TaxID=3047873 RepID=UPI0024C1850C|nr:proline racemase family protein [Neobacillus sp. WH10]WHY76570.1 proline racemase family protein [Neobacillus sp. WH10]
MRIEKAYSTIDVHVAGEAFRIIQNVPLIQYQSLKELDEKFPAAFQEEINLLLNEPRGFAGLNGCLVVPPINRGANAAVVFFNHEGTVPVHYGGIVAVMTALLECGHLKKKESSKYKIETVKGVIPVTAIMEKEEVVSVKLESDLCHVVDTDFPLSNPHLKTKFSLVQSDQLYAVFQKRDIPINIQAEELADLNKWGQTVIQALDTKIPVKGVILLDDAAIEERHIKTITFRNDCYIVRSPGFGPTLACYASLLSNGRVPVEGSLINESIFGSELEMTAISPKESSYQFVMTSRGFITGMQTFILDPTDPLAAGFLLK